MGKLPQYEAGVSAQANRRVVQMPVERADLSEAQGLQNIGKAASEIGRRVAQSDQDQQIARADRTAREQIDKLKADYEKRQDIPDDELEKQFGDASSKIVDEASKIIGSDPARRVWGERAKGYSSEGTLWAGSLGRKRQIDKVKAQHISTLSDLDQKAGDMSVAPDTYTSSLEGAKAVIKRDVERGILQAEEGAVQTARLDGLGVKDRSIRFEANVNELVKNGRVAEAQGLYDTSAKEVDPDVRARVKKGLEETKQDYRIVETADRLWEKSRGDYAKFVKETGKIDDAVLRQKVEERGDRMRMLADRAETVRQDGLTAQMWKHVESGGKIMNAPPGVRAAIDPDRLGAIRAYENARDNEPLMSPQQKAAHEAQSNTFRLQLETMRPERFVSGYASWSSSDKQRYDMLTPADQTAINAQVLERRTKGQTSNAVDAVYSDMVNQLKRVVPENWNIGKDKQTNEATKALGILRGYAQKAAATGKPTTADDARRAVATAMSELNTKKYPLGSGDQLENSTNLYVDKQMNEGSIDPDTWADVEDALYRKFGRRPSKLETLQVYNDIDAGVY